MGLEAEARPAVTFGHVLRSSYLWNCSGVTFRLVGMIGPSVPSRDGEAVLKCGTYYYGYSCCPAHGESEYFCLCIESTCGHKHATPTEAAACVENPCKGYVGAVSWGRNRALTRREAAKVQRVFDLRVASHG
jgi:hypothetical protein